MIMIMNCGENSK